MGQEFTYTQLVFGSIAFKLINLGQVAFHKLTTKSWVNFGPFLMTESWQSQVCRPPCSHMHFQVWPQIFYRIEVRALWWPLQYLDFVVLNPFCHNFRSMLEVTVHLEDPFATKLMSWLMSWDVASVYPHNFPPHDAINCVKCTSPSCSKAPPQHDAATPVLHGWDGVLRLASLHLFPPKITMVIMAKQFHFCFIRPEDISPKSMICVPMYSCKP